ncbi:hypothetical protein Pan258_57420 [Symmachiella dynata]|uniref:hypothetical protein n=1 Tax=Symmachiella dynata TaxID=2527995 RepID=UPI0011881E1E|nr:hypothetical protein [Symmachiella dynata]QDT51653.1 hypothetical protein Pan258_57420 [Symmachiella dynata]
MSALTNMSESAPLGATVVPGGVNYSLFSRTAPGVELLLFDREGDAPPPRFIPIEPTAPHSVVLLFSKAEPT